MIYYFSATGNNQYVAERIAARVGEDTKDIALCVDAGEYALSGETAGFVVPTYAWGLPEIVKRFFSRLTLSSPPPSYIFFVATYGTSPGFIGKAADKLLKERNIKVDAFFDVLMPDNWTVRFDLSDTDKVAETNRRADVEIEEMLGRIGEHAHGNFMKRTMPYWTSRFGLKAYENMRRTAHFHVDDTCVSCGLCEKKCPDHAIRMNGGRPEWIKEQCIMCLGCLHRCPKFAIQYDESTRKHGQYLHPGVKL